MGTKMLRVEISDKLYERFYEVITKKGGSGEATIKKRQLKRLFSRLWRLLWRSS